MYKQFKGFNDWIIKNNMPWGQVKEKIIVYLGEKKIKRAIVFFVFLSNYCY